MKNTTNKIHKPIYVYILTILFGPLAGGLMSGLDYKKAGDKKWPIILFAPTLISVVGLFILSLIFPQTSVPTIILPVFLGYVYQIYQKQLEENTSTKTYYSFWNSLGISLIGMIILLVPIIVVSI